MIGISVMARLSQDRLKEILDRADGHCHVCREDLIFENYGIRGADGTWEVDHSRARARGGTDHLNNLLPACPPCNQSKGTNSARSAREQRGFKRPPFSKVERQRNTWIGAIGGPVASGFLLGPIGLGGIAVSAVIGAAVGTIWERD